MAANALRASAESFQPPDDDPSPTLVQLLQLATPYPPKLAVLARLAEAEVGCENLLKLADDVVDAIFWDDAEGAEALKRARDLLKAGEAAIGDVVKAADAAQARLGPRDEAIRRRVERAVRSKVRDAKVEVFGSAASGLRGGPSADLDLCVMAPKFRREAAEAWALAKEADDLEAATGSLAIAKRIKAATHALRQGAEGASKARRLLREAQMRNQPDVGARLYDAERREAEVAGPLTEALEVAQAQVNEDVERSWEAREAADAGIKRKKKVVYAVERALRGARGAFHSFEVIAHARVPVVKCLDAPTGVELDVVPGNDVACANTRLLKAYGAHPTFRAVALAVKRWSKARGLDRAADGLLSSYGHALTVLHFCLAAGLWKTDFQEKGASGKRGASGRVVDGVDVGWAPVAPENAPPAVFLVAGYFSYMGGLDEAFTLSCRRQADGSFRFPKDRWPHKSEQARDQCLGRPSVEDPFLVASGPASRCHDVAATLDVPGAARLKAEYARAAACFRRLERDPALRVAEALEPLEPEAQAAAKPRRRPPPAPAFPPARAVTVDFNAMDVPRAAASKGPGKGGKGGGRRRGPGRGRGRGGGG